jgi:hypothetical protein
VRHPLPRAPPPDLQRRLAGAPTADAAREPRQRVVLLRQPWQRVLELRELHLELAVAALRPLGEDVQDQLRPIDHLQIGVLRDRARLRGRQVAIEDQGLGVELRGADQDVVELPSPHHQLRIDPLAKLEHRVDHLDAGGVRELAELSQAVLRRVVSAGDVLVSHVDEDRASVLGADLVRPIAAGKLLLEAGDERAEVDPLTANRQGPHDAVRLLPRLRGNVVREHGPARLTVRSELEGGDHVEPEPDEIDEIVLRQRLAVEVGVHQPETAKPPLGRTEAPDVGQHQPARIPHDDVVDLTGPMDERAHLPAALLGRVHERANELRRGDLRERHLPPVNALEELVCEGAEAGLVSVDLLHEGACSPQPS